MAKPDLARQWLDANKPEVSRNRKRKPGKTRKSVFAENRAVYESLDKQALHRLKWQTLQPWKRGSEVATGMDYLRWYVAFKGEECVYYPHVPPGKRTTVRWGDVEMPLSAAMCQLAHGPKEPGQVARHLCGNGHLSCINPKHLRWGSYADNSRDMQLHTGRPVFWPDLSPEVIEYVRTAKKLLNVLAVELDIHAAVLRTLR